jgi:hypothetical protein
VRSRQWFCPQATRGAQASLQKSSDQKTHWNQLPTIKNGGHHHLRLQFPTAPQPLNQNK